MPPAAEGLPPFDAIVVGSGYGGSVAALRLAEKGYRVLLLERGSEYLPGEFPTDFSLVPKFLRVNVPGRGNPMGRASGLVEFHVGQGLVGVTGNGLGGGSLINAGVAIAPDPDVFCQPEWPAALRHGLRRGPLDRPLARFLAKAARVLEAQPWQSGLPGRRPLAKTAALQRLAAEVAPCEAGSKLRRLKLTVDPAACVRCGDCAAGCNVPGAKKTLHSTYLTRAVATGRVQIVAQAEVYRFRQYAPSAASPGAVEHAPWELQVFATDVQHQYLSVQEAAHDATAVSTVRWIRAPMLFLCAGTFGSTALLQRSQSLAGDALAFSPALGTRLSGNGDAISIRTNEALPVHAVGHGLDAARQECNARADTMVGPTITGAIDLRDRQLPLEQRILIEDGAIPYALAHVFRELVGATWTLKQLDHWVYEPPRHAQGGAAEDPLAAGAGLARHTQVLLSMGHDGSKGRLVWLQGQDCAAPFLPDADRLETYVAQQRVFDAMGPGHAHSPLWQSVPASAQSLMSGARPTPTVTTVHPLGGCAMSDDPVAGVVNDIGQVWVHDPGRRFLKPADTCPSLEEGFTNEPRVYAGLYVLDGSIVPTALGCNPLLTITALAERALAHVPGRGTLRPPAAVLRSTPRAPETAPTREVLVAADLHEQLQGPLRLRGILRQGAGAGIAHAALWADFHAEDLLQALTDARHRLAVQARLVLQPAPGEGARAAAPLEYVSTGEAGTLFEALPANRTSSGAWPLCSALLQVAAFLAALLVLPAAALLGGGLPWYWAVAAFLAGAFWIIPLAALLLPLGRCVLTWWVLRGAKDLGSWLDQGPDGGSGGRLRRLGTVAASMFKQLVHASERRVMRYWIPMVRTAGNGPPGQPEQLVLQATKTVAYGASLREVAQWLVGRKAADGTVERPPLRPTFWEQIMDAEVRLLRAAGVRKGEVLAWGRLRMGFETLIAAPQEGGRRPWPGAMELGLRGDTTSGLLALAGYPLLFLRYALKTRLLDFRLPAYSQRPVPDAYEAAEIALRAEASGQPAKVMPELLWVDVPRGESSRDRGDESTQPLRLRLWRYRRRGVDGTPRPPEADLQAEWNGVPVVRARSVLLLHAFGQSGLSFTFHDTPQNLAEAFYEAGYEVWVLESRMSTRSGYATEPSTVDQIAAFDVPAAVRRMLGELAADLGSGQRPLQICAFAQCIGAAALWMALLSGKLSHGTAAQARPEADAPVLSMLSCALFSQVHPWLAGGALSQAKTWMPALLEVLSSRGVVPFAVRGRQDGWLANMMDRVFASMPAPAAEARAAHGHEDAAATCRRIRFIEAPLFRHENLNEETFAAMNRLFGDANVRLFAQARRFLERHRLVDEDGFDRYLTESNLLRHLAFPIQLLHGAANELFDPASVHLSHAALRARHPGWQQEFAPRPLLVPDYGHLDVLIGEHAHRDVYPQVMRFFRKVHAARVQAAAPERPCWMPRPPRVGPCIGWVRRTGNGQLKVRISLVIDHPPETHELEGAALPHMQVRLQAPDGQWHKLPPGNFFCTAYRAWTHLPSDTLLSRRPAGAVFAAFQTVICDITLQQGQWESGARLQVLSLHWQLLPVPGVAGLVTHAPDDSELDAYIAAYRVATAPGGPAAHEPTVLDFDHAELSFGPPVHPRADRVDFVAASCRHPGLGPDAWRVDHAIGRMLQHQPQPAFALLSGDQIYADATAGLLDSTSPLERYYERHEKAFSAPRMRKLLASLPTFMTPDDHEWADSYPAGARLVRERWPGPGYTPRERRAFRIAGAALNAFQRKQQPGVRNRETYRFVQGPVRVFVLDTRYHRKRLAPAILSVDTRAALEAWIRDGARSSRLSVLVTGSVLLPALVPNADPANPGVADNWQYAPGERQWVLETLAQHLPGRFLLVSGDYHLSGVATVQGAVPGQPERLLGAAVVVPPLYAPLPYVNAAPDGIDLGERIALAGGMQLGLQVPAAGSFRRGSGHARIHVLRTADGFEVEFRRWLTVWEEGREEVDGVPCIFTLPRAPREVVPDMPGEPVRG